MNIGFRPTLAGDERSFEVHFFDFEGNLYDKILGVEVLELDSKREKNLILCRSPERTIRARQANLQSLDSIEIDVKCEAQKFYLYAAEKSKHDTT